MGVDALGLSDAEFMEQGPEAFLSEEATETPEVAESAAEEATDVIDNSSDDQTEELDSEAQEQAEDTPDEEEVGQPAEDTPEELETRSESVNTESQDTSKPDSTDTDEDTQETTEFDYESAFKKVTEPFKANGADMQVKDPADIVRLMQMGANYQKKMAQLKPNLKLIKMLDNNQLLDEGKLSNLIDLSKKNPKAIAKLIKESGIDPLDVDTESSTDYKPTDYSVSEKEYDLDQVLEGIKDTKSFGKTIDVLTKEWDSSSKTAISDNPEIISIINRHMENGVFDKVNTVLQQEKTLGKLEGVSDVEAYRQVAEHLHKTGVLHEQTGSKTAPVQDAPKTDDKLAAKAKRNKKRKAVAPVKQTSSTKAAAVKNFLNLTDEEFLKQSEP